MTATSDYQEYIADKDMYIEISGTKVTLELFVYIQKSKIGSTPLIPKGGYNRALYEAAGAKYNEETGFYELNELTDITEDEMRIIYNNRVPLLQNMFGVCILTGRTNLWTNTYFNKGYGSNFNYNISMLFYNNAKIEIISLKTTSTFGISLSKIGWAFKRCAKLRKILGVLELELGDLEDKISFEMCSSLEEISLKGLKVSVLFNDSPLLSKDSILYMIQNSAATSPITITLHPTAYAMAMADDDIQAALEEKTFVSLASAE